MSDSASHDVVILGGGLAGLTHAPPAPWTSDRALIVGRPRFFSHKPLVTREP